MTTREPNPIPLVSFVLVQILWLSWYGPGVFPILGGIKAQVALLLGSLLALVLLSRTGVDVAVRRLAQHSQEVMLLLAFLFVNILNVVFGRGGMAYAYFVKALVVLVVYVTVVMHFRNDQRRYLQAAVALTVALGVIAAVVVPVLYANPFIARLGRDGELPWFGSWGFFMTFAIAMPCCFAVAHRQRGWLRVLLYALCVVMVLLIVLSTFAASILLLLMGAGGLLLLSVKKRAAHVVMVLAVIASVVVLRKYDLARIPQLENMGAKIATIFSRDPGSHYDDPNDPRVRAHLMMNSVHSFLANPVFGVGVVDAALGDDLVGNHSGIVDSLAEFGLFGVVWYFLFIGMGVRRLYREWRRDPDDLLHQARLVTFVVFLVGAFANPMLLDIGISTLVFVLALSPAVASANRPA